MSFSQKGIDKLRNFQEHMKMRHPEGDFVVSEGFDDGLFSAFPSCGPLGSQ
jgi:serine/threonine-protein kinase ULK2